MKTKRIVAVFQNNGEQVVLRCPQLKDYEDIMHMHNECARNKDTVNPQTRQTRKNERRWMIQRLSQVKSYDTVSLVAEISGTVVGGCSFWRLIGEPNVGVLGITLRKCARGRGIGSVMLGVLIDQVRRLPDGKKMNLLTLETCRVNHAAVALYKKFGFCETKKKQSMRIYHGKRRQRVHMERAL